jgi:DNA-binding transcriptional ArsR family regulator
VRVSASAGANVSPDAGVSADSHGQQGRARRPAPEHTHPDDVPMTVALAALADPVRLYLVRELARSADWERTCGSFAVPVGKAALSHHFAVLRGAGLIEQRDAGTKRANRLRRAEFDRRFPGLLAAVLGEG